MTNSAREAAGRVFVIACMTALAACGGGGDSGSPAAPGSGTGISTAEGLWTGTTNNGRSATGIVLDNGSFWVLYSVQGNSTVLAGAVQGTSSMAAGMFSSTDAKDANLEGLGILTARVAGSYVARQSFNGTVTYPTLGQSVTFTTTFNPAYDVTPSLATIAGAYTGTAAVVKGAETATVTIASSGLLNGVGATGCRFGGTATPRAKGNVYDVSVTFAGGVCTNGTSTVAGVAYFDTAAKRLYSAAVNSARTNGFIFVGVKP